MGILQEEENVGDVSLLAAASWPKIPWRMLYIDGVDTHAEGAPACVCVCVHPTKETGESILFILSCLFHQYSAALCSCSYSFVLQPPIEDSSTHRHPPPPTATLNDAPC